MPAAFGQVLHCQKLSYHAILVLITILRFSSPQIAQINTDTFYHRAHRTHREKTGFRLQTSDFRVQGSSFILTLSTFLLFRPICWHFRDSGIHPKRNILVRSPHQYRRQNAIARGKAQPFPMVSIVDKNRDVNIAVLTRRPFGIRAVQQNFPHSKLCADIVAESLCCLFYFL